jgi:hypothetical protein
MNQPLVHTTQSTKDRVKGPIEDLLKKRAESPDKTISERGLSMGEIIRALDLDKTFSALVSAALHKLRNEGTIIAVRGPATSARGPRYVKLYRASKRPPVNDDRRFLSLCR